jgi:redox-sensitive bicupin YhaK (pirin superfamily)
MNIDPSYEQKDFSAQLDAHKMTLLASPDGSGGSVKIHQDASIYAARLQRNGSVNHAIRPGRHAWLQMVRGVIEVNGQRALDGDGVAINDETTLTITPHADSEFLLFDLA